MGPLIYLSSQKKKTIQLMLRMFNSQYSSNYAQIMAAATVALIPVLILFICLQRYFVEGVASSGIKGFRSYGYRPFPSGATMQKYGRRFRF